MKKSILYVLLASVFAFLPISCQDDFAPVGGDLGDGECDLSFEMSYLPLENSLTRSPGNAVDGYQSLTILAYDKNNNLVTSREYSSSELTITEQNTPAGQYAEAKYSTAKPKDNKSFVLPFGYYRIFAVANLKLTAAEIATVDNLRSKTVTWDAKVANNNAMFGFFTGNGDLANINNSYDFEVNAQGVAVDGTEAPLIAIGKENLVLHAWLKRVVSKVTVSYDASGLNQGVYIYFQSLQIKDIPNTAVIGRCNSPKQTSELISDGEKMMYSTSINWEDWPSIHKGKSTFGSGHNEMDNALYLFENNQGKGTKHHTPQLGWEQNNFTKYDNALGSYIEVKGYYVNRNTNSHGPITYRFMLGQDVTSDFNTKRSCHYKVTLGFNKDANNPDWHIEYKQETPQIKIPDRVFISYGNNKTVNLPVKLDGFLDTDNPNVTVEIVSNAWYTDDHKYAYLGKNGAKFSDPKYGFLTFEDFYVDNNNSSFIRSKTVSTYKLNDHGFSRDYSIPLWTRPMDLGKGFSGYNFFFHNGRKAQVKVSGTFRGSHFEKTVEVIQVKRLENPNGVWRPHNSAKPFKVIVSTQPYEGAPNYEPLVSYVGPWTAVVDRSCMDWVEISLDGTTWTSRYVSDVVNSTIQFYYRPKGTIASDQVRYGMIHVYYHDNNCEHTIFVRQGYAPTRFRGSNFSWLVGNQYSKDKMVDTPTMEGSMFKYGNEDDAILAENNLKSGYGFYHPGTKNMAYCSTFKLNSNYDEAKVKADPYQVQYAEYIGDWSRSFDLANGSSKTWNNIGSKRKADEGFATMKVAKEEHWKTLANFDREYGILYGDECSETQLVTENAQQYLRPGDQKGMRGTFVYDYSNGTQLFFPIGTTGFGRRIAFDCNSDKTAYPNEYAKWFTFGAHLKYAQRHYEMPKATAENLPMLYNLFESPGAVYWSRNRVPDPNMSGLQTLQDGTIGFDMNYFTFGFEVMRSANIVGTYQNNPSCFFSDACFVRCVIE